MAALSQVFEASAGLVHTGGAQYVLIAKLSEGNGWPHGPEWGPAFPQLLLGHGLSLLPLGHLVTAHLTGSHGPWEGQ